MHLIPKSGCSVGTQSVLAKWMSGGSRLCFHRDSSSTPPLFPVCTHTHTHTHTHTQTTLGATWHHSFYSQVPGVFWGSTALQNSEDICFNEVRCLIFPGSCDNTCDTLSSGKGQERFSTQGLQWGGLCSHPSPGIYRDTRVPEGKQVFSINHIVYTNTLGTASHSYHLGKVLYQHIKLPSQVCRHWPRANHGIRLF